ncbi:HNH endonuclease [Agitococcus lubricus]|uniref:HNH endonuclease n=1 Tax=Agitococcus lubricus TaxID=1077255 RepID=A0A2T5J2X7_9GAMM|nr:HNH endonuclease [Agitococcus lubricus]PTQ90967.1 HNH endonuclease [Agitococcus lubricus]
MRFTNSQLEKIFLRSSGYCHICHQKLVFAHYGMLKAAGGWEVEHSNPQAKGGTHRLNNLYPACIRCNRAKGDGSSRQARSKHGKKRAPLSTTKRRRAKLVNALKGSVLGATTGIVGTIEIILVLAVLGTVIGFCLNPDRWQD